MGNISSSLINYVKKQYVVYMMKSLLCNAVNNAINDIDRTQGCLRFKKQTECVRQLADDWHAMVETVADKYADVKSTLVDVVNCFPLKNDKFNKSHVVCFCAFSVDLCVLMLNRKQDVNVNNVMQCLVESLISKNPKACWDFLKCVSL